MHFSSAFVLVAAAGFAAAQYTSTTVLNPAATSSTSSCVNAIEAIVTQCLKTETPKVNACFANDWTCLCAAQQQVVTCFNNCPSDSRAFGAQQTETQWCAAAKAYPSTSAAIKHSHAKPTRGPAPARNSAVPKAGTGSKPGAGHGSTTGGKSGAGAKDPGNNSGNGAGAVVAPVIGAVGVVVGAVALL